MGKSLRNIPDKGPSLRKGGKDPRKFLLDFSVESQRDKEKEKINMGKDPRKFSLDFSDESQRDKEREKINMGKEPRRFYKIEEKKVNYSTAKKPDVAITVPAELESALSLKTMQYFMIERPWLDLYGNLVQPVAPPRIARRSYVDPALIHRRLPDEMLFEVFVRLTAYDLGRASCVCRKWRYTIRNPIIWRNACLNAWQVSGLVENYKVLQSKYECSWRKMWLSRPRVRTDGLYVSKSIDLCVHNGRATGKINFVHISLSFRYVRFFLSGECLYQDCSETVRDAAKRMNIRASEEGRVSTGHYTVSDEQIKATISHVDRAHHVNMLTFWLRLRETKPGIYNRMDLFSLIRRYGDDDPKVNILESVERWEEDKIYHVDFQNQRKGITRKGITPFIFVPFEEVETSYLNRSREENRRFKDELTTILNNL